VAFTRKKMRLEQNLIDCFSNVFWNVFQNHCEQKMQLISDITNHCFFPPVCVDTREINLVAGVLVQDSRIVMTRNLTGWHLQVRRCVWNRILLIARNENWKPITKNYTNKCTPNLFLLRQQSFSFFPARVATHKISFGGWCFSTRPNDCNDIKSNWVAFTSKKMRLEQYIHDCAQWELKTQ
jgi:hypothetical protein